MAKAVEDSKYYQALRHPTLFGPNSPYVSAMNDLSRFLEDLDQKYKNLNAEDSQVLRKERYARFLADGNGFRGKLDQILFAAAHMRSHYDHSSPLIDYLEQERFDPTQFITVEDCDIEGNSRHSEGTGNYNLKQSLLRLLVPDTRIRDLAPSADVKYVRNDDGATSTQFEVYQKRINAVFGGANNHPLQVKCVQIQEGIREKHEFDPNENRLTIKYELRSGWYMHGWTWGKYHYNSWDEREIRDLINQRF